MSKGNLFLGFARGKVGDVVFARQNGEQITRARNRAPKNPQTPLQLLQRVILKSSSSAFSLMQEICNHSFQGVDGVTMNQARFNRLNIEAMRRQCSNLINQSDPRAIIESTLSNFSARNLSLPVMRPYFVSEGSLGSLSYGWGDGVFTLFCPNPFPGTEEVNPADVTYRQVCECLGISQGDQLTFMILGADDRSGQDALNGCFTAVDYARVIMDPVSDMGEYFVDANGNVNDPNPRNSGTVQFNMSVTAERYLRIKFNLPSLPMAASRVNSQAACAVILSRQSGGVWQRSSQQLALRPNSGAGVVDPLTWEYDVWFLGDAVLSYMNQANSSLYLNQAEG